MKQRHHLGLLNAVNSMQTYFSNFLSSRDQNDIETFEESYESKNAMSFYGRGCSTLFVDKWVKNLSLYSFLVISVQVFFKNVIKLVKSSLCL